MDATGHCSVPSAPGVIPPEAETNVVPAGTVAERRRVVLAASAPPLATRVATYVSWPPAVTGPSPASARRGPLLPALMSRETETDPAPPCAPAVAVAWMIVPAAATVRATNVSARVSDAASVNAGHEMTVPGLQTAVPHPPPSV